MESGMKWRWTALIVYLTICVFDFIIVPIWFGMMRPDYQMFLEEVRAIMAGYQASKKSSGMFNGVAAIILFIFLLVMFLIQSL